MIQWAIYAAMVFCALVVLWHGARPKRRRKADQPWSTR